MEQIKYMASGQKLKKLKFILPCTKRRARIVSYMKDEIFSEKLSHFCADCAIMERVCRKDVRKCQNRAMPPTHGS